MDGDCPLPQAAGGGPVGNLVCWQHTGGGTHLHPARHSNRNYALSSCVALISRALFMRLYPGLRIVELVYRVTGLVWGSALCVTLLWPLVASCSLTSPRLSPSWAVAQTTSHRPPAFLSFSVQSYQAADVSDGGAEQPDHLRQHCPQHEQQRH